MPLPELLKRSATREVAVYCDNRTPDVARDQMRLERSTRGSAITIWECRPSWRPEYGPDWTRRKIAQLRNGDGGWTLWWADRNGRWLEYPCKSQPRVADALAVIDRDTSGAFFG